MAPVIRISLVDYVNAWPLTWGFLRGTVEGVERVTDMPSACADRLARGEVTLAQGAPGDPVPLPDQVSRVRRGEREWPVEGGGFFRPADVGAYYLLAAGDTVGAIAANIDPRESLLAPAADEQVRRLWAGARIVDPAEVGELAFSVGAMGDLRGPLLWAALALGVVELVLATLWRRQR